MRDPEEESLSAIIARLNERFGTDWTEEDRLVFEAAAGDLVNDAELQNQAINNDAATFRNLIFPGRYEKALLGRLDKNADLIYSYLDSDELQSSIMDVFAVEVQKRATVARQRTCPIGDLLGPDRESLYLEYKSTLRWDIKAQKKGSIPEDAVIKTIVGFANAPFGGTLLVGVADDGTVHGLEDDYATFSKRGERGDQDLWGQHLGNLIRSRLGDSVVGLINWEFHSNGDDLARVSIDPCQFPVYETKGGDQVFWSRTPVSTIAVTEIEERDRIIARRWGSSGGV
jgi:type I restriction enzyme R subunit